MSVLCGSQGCHVCRVCGLSGSVMVVPGSTGLPALIVDLCWMWTAATCLSAVCGSCPRPLPQLESPASRSEWRRGLPARCRCMRRQVSVLDCSPCRSMSALLLVAMRTGPSVSGQQTSQKCFWKHTTMHPFSPSMSHWMV